MIESLYPVALDAGVATSEFWGMSLMEIYDTIESYRRTIEQKRRITIDQEFTLADAIATRIIYFFEDTKDRRDDQILRPWDAYPDLFTNEEDKAQENKEKLLREKHIADMRAFAAAYRKRQKG